MRKLLTLLLLAILFTNCTLDSTDDLTLPTPTSITYTINVKTIID
ncbi:hypothetical protein [Polaribacter uvawellassae]